MPPSCGRTRGRIMRCLEAPVWRIPFRGTLRPASTSSHPERLAPSIGLFGRPLDTASSSLCQALQQDKALSGVSRTVARRVNVRGQEEYSKTPDRFYINFTGFPFPIGPLLFRKTTAAEIVPGTIWSFEQPQSLAFSNVAVNVRMTVVRLSTEGLLVYNPIAPTREMLRMLAALREPVRVIVLGTAAYEHKVFVGPFSRRFPRAEVYVGPQQWSFPLPLPLPMLGIFPAGTISGPDEAAPWAPDFDVKVFAAPKFAVAGLYTEVALFHRASRTVLVTDAVIEIPRRPPACISPASLLDNAKNGFVVRTADAVYGEDDTAGRVYDGAPVRDTPANRLRGWQRICLLVSFFGPSSLYDPEPSFNLYAGRPFVFPVVSSLVYSRVPTEVRAWVEEIAKDWPFKQIVPSHFGAPVQCNGRELVAAFQRSTDVYSRPTEATTRGSDRSVGPDRPQGLLQRLLALRKAGSRPGDSVLDRRDLKALENVNWFLEAVRAVRKRPERL